MIKVDPPPIGKNATARLAWVVGLILAGMIAHVAWLTTSTVHGETVDAVHDAKLTALEKGMERIDGKLDMILTNVRRP